MSLNKSPTALRTIGEVSDDLDVAAHILRFWESKFRQIKPQKRRGRRYYRPEDVQLIDQIKTLLYNEGYTIRGVQKYLSDEVKFSKAANANPNIVTSHDVTFRSAESSEVSSVGQVEATSVQQRHAMNRRQQAEVVAPASAPVLTPSAVSDSVPALSEEKVVALQQIYKGLCEAKEKLLAGD